jgi:hypothetical protein
MGRISLLNNTQSVLDLYRYSSQGVLDTTGGSAYFSTDGGKTSIKAFNGDSNIGDLGDWAISGGDAFNYAAGTNQALPFSSADLKVMQALGYVDPVPEPETYAMLLAGLGLIGFMRRCKKA